MSDAYYDIASGGSASAIRAGLNTMNRKLVNVSLPVEVAITDADVAMVANRRYVGSTAAFTADRNYTLPAGTAGDIIEVQLTAGDDTYELILLGASGVSINGGSAATEWSRLFISNEFVRFRCHATNDWRVEYDGRAFESVEIFGTATTAFVDATWTRTVMGGSAGETSLVGTNEIVVRRSGIYTVRFFHRFQPSGLAGEDDRLLSINVDTPSAAFNSANAVAGFGFVTSTAANQRVQASKLSVSANAGQAISGWYYTDGINGTNQYLTGPLDRPSLEVRRVG